MKLQAVTPMLRTPDVKSSVAFYTQVLGFECERYSKDWVWASLKKDKAALMLSNFNMHEGDKQPAFTGSLYFKTDSVDALWKHVREKAQVCYPLESFEYGMREFGIYDNNGYLLQFGQTVEKA